MPRGKKKSDKDNKPVFSPVHIPDAVRKADELATKKQQELQPKDPDDDVIVDKIEDDPTAVDPETVPPVNPVDPPANPPVQNTSPSEWENKYKVLQGKYNAELGEIRNVVTNLQQLVAQQNGLITQLQSQPAPAAPETSPAPDGAGDFNITPVNPDDFTGYGDDIVFLARGFNQLLEANQKQAGMIAQLANGGGHGSADNQRLERVEAFITESAQERYNREMDTQVPKWREILYSDDFVGWLNGVDPLSNYRYRDMFDYAQKNFRHQQAAEMIRRYALDRGANIGQPGSPSKPEIVDNTRTPLSDQVMPDASTGGDPNVNPANAQREEYPSQQDVAKASDLYAQGKITAKKFNEISDKFMMGLKVGAIKPI